LHAVTTFVDFFERELPKPAAIPAHPTAAPAIYHGVVMSFPIKVCVVCSEEFELRPDKPGFANRCPECSAADEPDATAKRGVTSERDADRGLNEARRNAMRNLLYRKE
jgi:hypothetical protein